MGRHRKHQTKYRTEAVTEALMESVADLKLRRLEAMRQLSRDLAGSRAAAV